jgi:signal transduction histidine kinase
MGRSEHPREWRVIPQRDEHHLWQVVLRDDPKIVRADEGMGAGPVYRCLEVPGRLSDVRARLRAWPPLRVDALLAALVLAEGLVEALLAAASLPARLSALGPLVLVAAGVVVRRRRPVEACALAAAGVAGVGLLVPGVRDDLQGLFFAWLFVNYSLATRVLDRQLAAGVAIAVAGTVLAVAGETHPQLQDLAFAGLLFVVAPLFAGRMLHHRVRLADALREKAQRAERDRARRVEEAATEERTRIAGELHDVVAHALGAMTIQAAAARRLAETDAGRATGAFEAIETTGRGALAELRTLLDVLRGDEEQPAREPQPGLASLQELVARTRAAGLPVELEVHGSPETLPASVDLAAYRIVQEALAAAADEGGAGRARVIVRHTDEALEVEVLDDGRPRRDLLGLQERARVFGGQVRSGQRRSGGHVVRARLPLGGVTA